MRLLGCIQSTEERNRIAGLLESRGIPVFQEQNARTIRNPTCGAIFVCINSQYEDAVALLANENYEVKEPVDVEQFRSAARDMLPSILKASLLVLGAIVAAWAVVMAIRRWS